MNPLVRLWESSLIRWITLVPVVLVVVGVVQAAGAVVGGYLIELTVGEHVPFLAKCFASPFMGASIVLVATWWAPSRRRVVLLTATGLTVCWGAWLSMASLLDKAAPLVLWMGILGATGGLLSAWLHYRNAKPGF